MKENGVGEAERERAKGKSGRFPGYFSDLVTGGW